jgi:murein L,D-transpeptidase YcbB/YkuD
VVNSKKNKTILLSHPINIHILYWTAWVDNDGIINFREDIYGRDSRLNIALNEKATSPEVLYGTNSKKRYFSSLIPPASHPINIK